MIRSLLLAAALTTSLAGAGAAQGVAGPYLAARIAGYSNDYRAAGDYYAELLRQDGAEASILENAIIIFSVLGEFDAAADAAIRLEEAGRPSQFADNARMVRALGEGDFDTGRGLLDGDGVGGALLDGLLAAWIELADGDVEAGYAAFDTLAEAEGLASFANLHKAYALAMQGDDAAADGILSGRTAGTLNLDARGIAAHAEILVRLDRRADAVDLLAQANEVTNSPLLQALAVRVEAGEEMGEGLIATPQDGMAEAYFTLAVLLDSETSATFTLLNAQAAATLRPGHVESLLLAGAILERQDRYALAGEVLSRVPPDDPSFFGAEIARAEVLQASGEGAAAVEVLEAVTELHPDRRTVWAAYADALRREERYEAAVTAYDRAIELQAETGEESWFLYYARGISEEQSDDWTSAEVDFRRALELNPDQPLVLNYLGYGLVEQRMKLDEALEMIERAVAARPDDGYITDSLAWVLYRLGRPEEAVEPMERAVMLTPLDPLINDHLGDVLWAVGRKREARFQWRRALSLEPDEGEAPRIRRKLEVGLDTVLEEEGGVGAIEAVD